MFFKKKQVKKGKEKLFQHVTTKKLWTVMADGQKRRICLELMDTMKGLKRFVQLP